MPKSVSIQFLGTSSAQPSLTRNTSSLAIIIDGFSWLFDVGEATQHQLNKFKNIKWGKIDKIFITHMHGDHVFGLPPLLCTLSNNLNEDLARRPIEIYGPSGLRKFVYNSLSLTHSHLKRGYIVHELLFPDDPIDSGNPFEPNEFEQSGENIQMTIDQNNNRSWKIIDEEDYIVSAAPIEHSIPCLGYVINENPIPGNINIELVKPILMRNKDALGLKNPMELLKKLQQFQCLTMPDGTVIEPPQRRPGRKIVILGDTFDPSGIIHLAMDADVLVHEATNSLTSDDPERTIYEDVEKRSIENGHSTSKMAGKFAARINAQQLLLNHFSHRYKGDSEAIMNEIKQAAIESFGNNHVICTYDGMIIQIPIRKEVN
ncbi:beta-lactamase-like protein [Glomus cerebriforme]|uniref:Beta-lactamase-like protein n=1 Tax=Glomus cerebriforme TaxID=658196 RepID=A0A397S6S8_9GLOM|nr:beta-lactamase-like protein [Glomus cerebriforme]